MTFLVIVFFIVSLIIAFSGVVLLGFQGEYIRTPTFAQKTLRGVAIVLFIVPLGSTVWFVFWKETIPFQLGGLFPPLCMLALPFLAYRIIKAAEKIKG